MYRSRRESRVTSSHQVISLLLIVDYYRATARHDQLRERLQLLPRESPGECKRQATEYSTSSDSSSSSSSSTKCFDLQRLHSMKPLHVDALDTVLHGKLVLLTPCLQISRSGGDGVGQQKVRALRRQIDVEVGAHFDALPPHLLALLLTQPRDAHAQAVHLHHSGDVATTCRRAGDKRLQRHDGNLQLRDGHPELCGVGLLADEQLCVCIQRGLVNAATLLNRQLQLFPLLSRDATARDAQPV